MWHLCFGDSNIDGAAMENTRNVKSPRVCDGGGAAGPASEGCAVVNCDQNTEWSLMKRGRRRPTEEKGAKDIAKLRTADRAAFKRGGSSERY